MKHLFRFLTALLTLAMLLPFAVACADPAGPDQTTEGIGQTEAPGSDPAQTTAEETDFAKSNIPEDLQFPGTTVKFLHWDDSGHNEFFVVDEDANFVDSAIFARNERVQEQFDITLEFTGIPGSFQKLTEFVNTCVNSTQSGADAHDIFAGYSMSGATLTTQGVTQDMTKYDIMEFDKPWWPSTLIEKATINDGIYFASGDISTTYLYMMYSCFFNKNMFKDLVGETSELYDLVYDGTWTVDKMIEFATGIYSDTNGDNAVNEGDRFGFTTSNVHLDSFYTGAGLSTVVTDDGGNLVLSEDLFSQRTIDLLTKLCAFLHDSGESSIMSSTDNSATQFAESQALFASARLRLGELFMTNSDFTYGLVPAPKYDTDQKDYRTCIAFGYSMYLLSEASPDPEAAAATLELMAYQSYLLTTPALFDQSMKLRYSDASDDSAMYDIIRENVVIDVGRLFSSQLSNLSYSIFRNAVTSNAPGSYASTKAAQEKMFQRSLDKVNDAISKLQ